LKKKFVLVKNSKKHALTMLITSSVVVGIYYVV